VQESYLKQPVDILKFLEIIRSIADIIEKLDKLLLFLDANLWCESRRLAKLIQVRESEVGSEGD
jgi:hypothetical protein